MKGEYAMTKKHENCIQEIKLGTIGSGIIVHSILNGVKATEGISLEAVYSRSKEKGEKLAKEYGASKVYTDLQTFMEDPEINFIYIASPNSLHYQHAKMALQHNKNVILEKPFCPGKAQVDELIALAEEKNLYLIDAVVTTFLPNYELLLAQLPKIGKPRIVLCNYSQYSSRYDQLRAGEITNAFNPAFAGGCIQDINFYNIYFNVALFGKPSRAVYYPNRHSNGIDTSGIILMQYKTHVSECTGAKDTWGVNSVQIQGEDGYIYIKGGSNGLEEIRVVTKTSEEVYNNQDNPDRWFYEISNMTGLILNGDRDAFCKRLKITTAVIEVIENARKEAGILFPGE